MTRWGFATTGDEVVEAFKERVKGKIIVITGPSAGGIGAETAISLAAGSPALLILTGRSEAKISPVIETIHSKFPSVTTRFVPIDLASLSSVRKAAAAIKELTPKINILINNAAIMVCPYSKSEDGIEMQFATNYVGHFLLTNLLAPQILEAGSGARIICVSSSAHRSGRVRFEDVNFQDGKVYNEWEAYGQSKSAMILFAHALAARLEKHRSFAYSLHPGSIRSGLQIHMAGNDALLQDGLARAAAAEKELGREYKRPPQKTLQQGCSTTLVAALDPEIESRNGAYLVDGDISDVDPPENTTSKESQEKLWKLSEDLVGGQFNW